jgi:hypothetical protein
VEGGCVVAAAAAAAASLIDQRIGGEDTPSGFATFESLLSTFSGKGNRSVTERQTAKAQSSKP